MGGSLGFNQSQNNASSNQDVWTPQGNALSGVYDSARDLYGGSGKYTGETDRLASGISDANQGIAQGATGGMNDLLGGGSYGDTGDIRAQLLESLKGTAGGSNMGRMFDSIVGGSGNSYIDPMVDSMRAKGGEALDTMVNSNAMDAGALGQGGSSRHAMQNAMLQRGGLDDMNRQEAEMRGGAYDKDLGMKMDIARQADSGVQSTQQRLMDMLSGADSNVKSGMGYAPTAQSNEMGSMAPWMQSMQNAWAPMQNYANIIGGPTVLGRTNSSGSGMGMGAGASLKG